LFEGIHDDRVQVVTPGPDKPDPDLVVFSCGNDRHFTNVPAAEISDRTRARIVSGDVGLVFDATTEGVKHKAHTTTEFHDVLKYLGASPRKAVYLTQDRQYEQDYRAYCASAGFDPVTVLNHDYWVWYAFAQYEHDGDAVFEQRLDAFRSRPGRRKRRFVSLNRTARDAKVIFLLNLLKDGLWDKGFVSFGGFKHPDERRGERPRPTPESLERSLPGFADKIAELAPFLDALDARGRVLLGMKQHKWKRLELWNASLAAELAEYNHSWFSVATETEMRPYLSRITEKSVKPLANFHPMFVLGNPGALAMIRSYGFVTFGEVFDESYDDELDPRRRFDLVYEQVVRLCRMSEDELAAIERRVEEKLIFNARWGLTTFPREYRTQRDVALVNQILQSVEWQPRDDVVAQAGTLTTSRR
jgi:hypothetical protein